MTHSRKKSNKRLKVGSRAMRAAAAAPLWIRNASAATFDPQADRAFKNSQLGRFGPASEVRHIDIAEYLAEKGEEPK